MIYLMFGEVSSVAHLYRVHSSSTAPMNFLCISPIASAVRAQLYKDCIESEGGSAIESILYKCQSANYTTVVGRN
jgi:hypothetical protein